MAAIAPGLEVHVVENGCDFDEFDGLEYTRAERFRITHTGSFFGRRNPRPFLEALGRTDEHAVARFIGGLPQGDLDWALENGLAGRIEVRPFVTRREALALERDSDALLLLIPDAGGRGRGVLTAKIFEYLAAERPILAAVPRDGDAAALIREAGAGPVVGPDRRRGDGRGPRRAPAALARRPRSAARRSLRSFARDSTAERASSSSQRSCGDFLRRAFGGATAHARRGRPALVRACARA